MKTIKLFSSSARHRFLLLMLLTLFTCGNVWGETITLTQSALGLTGSYTTNTVKTVSNVDFTYTDLMKNNSNIQAKASSGKIYNSSLVPGKITNVAITHSGTARATTIFMGTSSSSITTQVANGSGSISGNAPANTCPGYFKITRGSNAAYWTQVVITYTPATITLSKSSITGLNYAVGGGPSAAQTFTVSGSNIPANLTVTAPTNFEVSLDGSSWASSKTINVTLTGSASAGTLSSTTIYVRLASGKSAGNYSGNVSIAMAGCKTISSVNPKTVAVSGTVSAASYTVGWSITDGGGTLSTTSGMSTTVTPASGYRYASPAYTILTGSATVVQSSNTFSATPTDNSTIRINMEQIPSHNIIFNTGGLVTIPSASVLEGATYDITEDPSASLSDDCEYNTFVGWTMASSIADPSVKPSLVTSVTMSTSDVTLYAVYSKTEGSGGGETYDKVTSTDDIEDGQYLVVCESQSVAFNGGLSTLDASSNTISVDISSNQIAVSSTTEDAEFTIDATNQTIQSASGYYIDRTSGTSGGALHTTTSNPQSHTFSIDNSGNFVDQASVTGTHSYLKYNANSGQERFRYYVTGQTDIQLYKKSSGTTTYSLNPSCDGPMITVSKTSIDFGDVKVGGSYTETFTVSGENLTGAVNLAVSGPQAGRYSVSPTTLSPAAGTVAETIITVTFAPTASSDHAAQVDITSDGATAKTVSLHAISKWEVTWKNDGAVYETTFVQGGHKPDFPATPTSCDGVESNVFYGWTDAEWPGKIDDVSAKTIHKSNATMPNASNNTTIYYAVFVKRTGSVDEYTDDLTRATTGISSGSSYGAWSGKSASNTGHSSAVYAGQSAGGNDAIQLRATSPSGIITTTSGGKAKKVTVVWNSNTADGRTLDIYGKNAAYEAASDLYDNAKLGTKIGSIVYGTSTELTITDDYEYIGIRSNTNALYLDKISIDWQEGDYTYSKYMTNCCDKNVTLAHNSPSNGTVTFSPAGPIATCSATAADRQTTMTITPNPGYKLTSWSTTGVTPASVSPAVATSGDDSKSAQAITVTFTQNTTTGTYTANATFTAMVDHFIDKLHETTGYTESDNHAESAKYTVPNLSDKSAPSDETCEQLHYKFVGWVAADDVDSDGTLIGSPTILTGGTTNHPASDKTYWAIWAKEL